MIKVDIGSAMISPGKPSKLPQIDSESSMIAGCSPVTLFMILGINKLSCIA